MCQNALVDSLRQVIKTSRPDSVKLNTLLKIGGIFERINPDTATEYYKEARDLAINLMLPVKKGEAIRKIGWCKMLKGDYPQAIGLLEEVLLVAEKEIGSSTKADGAARKLKAAALGNIGVVYYYQSNYAKAVDYYFKALKLNEDIKNKKGMADNYINIGIVHFEQSSLDKARDYYFKALRLNEKLNDARGVANNLGNIGNLYYQQKDYNKALEYYFLALKKNEELENKAGMASNFGNIGVVYVDMIDYNKALEYYMKSLKIKEELGSKMDIATTISNIGSVYIRMGKYKQSEECLKKALSVSEEIGEIYTKENTYFRLYELYSKIGRYKEALEMFKNHIDLRDTINNSANQRAAVQKEMQFNYDKERALREAEHQKQMAFEKALGEKQKTIAWFTIVGFILVVILSIFIYNRLRITKKQKQIIEVQKKYTEEQKQIIESKHKEITDSINYAERIQRSFLATAETLNNNLKDYFVFFMPKDIVSGDFYWASELKNGDFAYVTADSTGHGVPGAIMSILNISSLEKSIEKETAAGKILSETRKIIIDRLKKDGSDDGGKDGMDASLVILNRKRDKLAYAAANIPIWVVRNNALLEFEPDKMPVGKHDKEVVPFREHEFDLQKGDVIYTFTDGYPDQFGGSKGKKFMYRQLKELLLSISEKPLNTQKEILFDRLSAWKGNLEQVDDITIIGVKI